MTISNIVRKIQHHFLNRAVKYQERTQWKGGLKKDQFIIDWDEISPYGYPKDKATTLDWELDEPYGSYIEEEEEEDEDVFVTNL